MEKGEKWNRCLAGGTSLAVRVRTRRLFFPCRREARSNGSPRSAVR